MEKEEIVFRLGGRSLAFETFSDGSTLITLNDEQGFPLDDKGSRKLKKYLKKKLRHVE